MEKNIRFAGAQIPCSSDLKKNVQTLKEAIDWCYENSVDYLVTPEGSLTGYIPDFDTRDGRTFEDVKSASEEVVTYAAEKNLGLFLGTLWIEKRPEKIQREDQIRYYNKQGQLSGTHTKIYRADYENTDPNFPIDNMIVSDKDSNINVLGTVCNDFWGGPIYGFMALPLMADQLMSHIIIHSTNAFRGEEPEYDAIMDSWHDGNLKLWSYHLGIPILTVDNCCKSTGEDYNGPTSSQSGVIINGQWQTSVPREGTQYFYYDFDVDRLISKDYKRPFKKS